MTPKEDHATHTHAKRVWGLPKRGGVWGEECLSPVQLPSGTEGQAKLCRGGASQGREGLALTPAGQEGACSCHSATGSHC